MPIITGPKFNPPTENRSSFENPKLDINKIVFEEFNHATMSIMLFKKNYDAIDKYHEKKLSWEPIKFISKSQYPRKFNFTDPGSRTLLLESFRRRPQDWNYQDTILIKAFIAFCDHVEKLVGHSCFHLTSLSRQDFMSFMKWNIKNRPSQPIFKKFLTWDELKEAIKLLKLRESSLNAPHQKHLVELEEIVDQESQIDKDFKHIFETLLHYNPHNKEDSTFIDLYQEVTNEIGIEGLLFL